MRRYSFHSDWTINATPEKVWQLLTATPFSWDKWWPELTDLTTISSKPQTIGTQFSCTWHAQSGYELHCTFTVTDVLPGKQISFDCAGDLQGEAIWYFAAQNNATAITIDWQADTDKWWMKLLAPALRPLFIRNHDAIMSSGERGLNNYLLVK